MFNRGSRAFVSALAVTLVVLGIIGGGAVFNYALESGVAWAQLVPWTDGGSYLYPTQTTDDVITGANTVANADIYLGADGSAVFNEQGSDSDFRVEGDGDSNLLFVDAGNDRVCIGNNGGYTKLYVYEGGTPALPATTCQFMMQNSEYTNSPAGIEIVSGSQSTSHIMMGDEGAPGASMIMHDNNTDDLTVTATGDIELDGDVIELSGGFESGRTEKNNVDYQALDTDYYIAYTNVNTGGSLYVDMPHTESADAGRVMLVGTEGYTTGTLTIRDYDDNAVSGDRDIMAAGELRHVICTGEDSWYAY